MWTMSAELTVKAQGTFRVWRPDTGKVQNLQVYCRYFTGEHTGRLPRQQCGCLIMQWR